MYSAIHLLGVTILEVQVSRSSYEYGESSARRSWLINRYVMVFFGVLDLSARAIWSGVKTSFVCFMSSRRSTSSPTSSPPPRKADEQGWSISLNTAKAQSSLVSRRSAPGTKQAADNVPCWYRNGLRQDVQSCRDTHPHEASRIQESGTCLSAISRRTLLVPCKYILPSLVLGQRQLRRYRPT